MIPTEVFLKKIPEDLKDLAKEGEETWHNITHENAVSYISDCMKLIPSSRLRSLPVGCLLFDILNYTKEEMGKNKKNDK